MRSMWDVWAFYKCLLIYGLDGTIDYYKWCQKYQYINLFSTKHFVNTNHERIFSTIIRLFFTRNFKNSRDRIFIFIKSRTNLFSNSLRNKNKGNITTCGEIFEKCDNIGNCSLIINNKEVWTVYFITLTNTCKEETSDGILCVFFFWENTTNRRVLCW